VGLDNEAQAHLKKQEAMLLRLATTVEKMGGSLNEAEKRTKQLADDLKEANVRFLQSEKRAASAEGEAARLVAQMQTLHKGTSTGTSRELVSGSIISYKEVTN
jgi:hypothetical protein